MGHALLIITLFHVGLWTAIGVLVRLEPPRPAVRLTLVSDRLPPVEDTPDSTPHETAA